MKFLHAADIHLDSPLRGLEQYEGAPVEQLRGASRRALERLVKLALDEQVDFVLIAGDVYDGKWKDYNTGLFFISQMARLQHANIPVVMIRGNHDAESEMTKSLRLPENVTLLSTTKFQTHRLEPLGVAVHGRSFAKREELENLAARYPAGDRGVFNIGLLHTCLVPGPAGSSDHEPYAPCSLDDLHSKGYQYWALGHVHERQSKTVTEDCRIEFPGNLQGRHIREPGAKGCLLVEVNERGHSTTTFKPLDVLRWEHAKIDCKKAEQPDDILGLCDEHFRGLLEKSDDLPLAVRVTLHGATATHTQLHAQPENWVNQIRASAISSGSGQIWIEKVRLATSPSGSLDDAAEAEGPLGELIRYVREVQSDDDALRELAAQLDDLRRKLPLELIATSTGDVELLRFDDPMWIKEILGDVEPLLISRLQSREVEA